MNALEGARIRLLGNHHIEPDLFHESLDNVDKAAEKLSRHQPGTYLLRPSSQAGAVTLTFVEGGIPVNIRLFPALPQGFYLGEDRFDSILSMIELMNMKNRLKHPLYLTEAEKKEKIDKKERANAVLINEITRHHYFQNVRTQQAEEALLSRYQSFLDLKQTPSVKVVETCPYAVICRRHPSDDHMFYVSFISKIYERRQGGLLNATPYVAHLLLQIRDGKIIHEDHQLRSKVYYQSFKEFLEKNPQLFETYM